MGQQNELQQHDFADSCSADVPFGQQHAVYQELWQPGLCEVQRLNYC